MTTRCRASRWAAPLASLSVALFVHATAVGQLRTAAERGAQALMEGRCESALEPLNQGLKDGDPDAYFLVGLMHVKGFCVKADPARGPSYLEPAAKAAQADAARLLVMMHGFGIGVAQSFAQAGRWTLAWSDIQAMKNGKAPAVVESGDGQPRVIRADEAELLGVLGSVAAAVQDRVTYPPRSAAALSAAQVSLNLELRLDSGGVQYKLSDVRADVEDDIRSTIMRRSPQPYVDHLSQVVDGVIKELAPHPRPQAPFVFRVPYKFILR